MYKLLHQLLGTQAGRRQSPGQRMFSCIQDPLGHHQRENFLTRISVIISLSLSLFFPPTNLVRNMGIFKISGSDSKTVLPVNGVVSTAVWAQGCGEGQAGRKSGQDGG